MSAGEGRSRILCWKDYFLHEAPKFIFLLHSDGASNKLLAKKSLKNNSRQDWRGEIWVLGQMWEQ